MKSLLFGKVSGVFYSSFWRFLCALSSPRGLWEQLLWCGMRQDAHIVSKPVCCWAQEASGNALVLSLWEVSSQLWLPDMLPCSSWLLAQDHQLWVVVFWLWSQGATSQYLKAALKLYINGHQNMAESWDKPLPGHASRSWNSFRGGPGNKKSPYPCCRGVHLQRGVSWQLLKVHLRHSSGVLHERL